MLSGFGRPLKAGTRGFLGRGRSGRNSRLAIPSTRSFQGPPQAESGIQQLIATPFSGFRVRRWRGAPE
jgi:hypothetical protein